MTDEITYHLLGPENADRLLGAEVFDNPVDPAQLAGFVADRGHEMVFATAGVRVVGVASGRVLRHPDKQPAFFISEVGVVDDLRRRGIASTLMEMLLQIARDKDHQGIWLATETDNVAARALYTRLAAQETEAVVIYDWDGAMDT